MSIETLSDQYLATLRKNLALVKSGVKVFRREGMILEEIVHMHTGWTWAQKAHVPDFIVDGQPVDLKASRYPKTIFVEYVQNIKKGIASPHWEQEYDLVYVNTHKDNWGKAYRLNMKALKQYVAEQKIPLVRGGYYATGYILDPDTLVELGIASIPFPPFSYNPWDR